MALLQVGACVMEGPRPASSGPWISQADWWHPPPSWSWFLLQFLMGEAGAWRGLRRRAMEEAWLELGQGKA